MSTDQERSLRILDGALRRIARRSDCEYLDDEKSRPTPCDCPRCVALAALADAKNWRFHGAHHDRILGDHFPREVKMQASWMKLATQGRDPDTLMAGAILQEDRVPSARDWYVATSVVQWLATNVGMTVLEGAGFKYTQWEQDQADGPLFQRRLDRENEPASASSARSHLPAEARRWNTSATRAGLLQNSEGTRIRVLAKDFNSITEFVYVLAEDGDGRFLSTDGTRAGALPIHLVIAWRLE